MVTISLLQFVTAIYVRFALFNKLIFAHFQIR